MNASYLDVTPAFMSSYNGLCAALSALGAIGGKRMGPLLASCSRGFGPHRVSRSEATFCAVRREPRRRTAPELVGGGGDLGVGIGVAEGRHHHPPFPPAGAL